MSHSSGPGMITTILKWTGIGIALVLFILWIVSGGLGKIWAQAKLFTNPVKDGVSGGVFFKLPGQDAIIPKVYVDNRSSGGGAATEEERDPKEELEELQTEYEDLEAAIQEAKEFGTPSPYRGDVRISKSNAGKTDVDEEYIRLTAASGNTAPIHITGWSLQSVLSGIRIYIPRGTDTFLMGTVNVQGNISLAPGGSAIALSGQSPVGTSFRENLCTGYLNQLQTFTPKLPERCPSSANIMPLTTENLQVYGDACVDFVRTISSCRAPIDQFTTDLSQACMNYLANELSYNGCVESYRYRSDFTDRTWRVYLNASSELWRNTHDVIRLLDAEGRTVDSITY